MAESWKAEKWAQAEDFWYSGKTTRRRFLGLSAAAAGALGATMLVPAPWRDAFGQAKPFKIGTLQPLSGTAAAGGKTALVGTQMAVDRINKSGGINGRPIELMIADYESKPDVGRRKAEKLVVEDKIDAHAGRLPLERVPGLHAGVRGAQDRQHDRRVPRHHDHHEQVQPLHLPALRLRAGAGRRRSRRTWSTRWARSGTSPTPTTRGASPPATPTPSRSRRRAARSSAPRASRSAPPT